MNRTYSDKIPSTIERDSNGYYLYLSLIHI